MPSSTRPSSSSWCSTPNCRSSAWPIATTSARALIDYQRQRRALQGTEDDLKFQIRQEIRNLQQQYLTYEIAKRNFVLQVRQKDQSFEQIVAPPQSIEGSTQGAIQTQNLIQAQSGILRLENNLVQNWLAYQQARLNLYRDLGTLPYDEWEAYHELFPPKSDRPGPAPAAPPSARDLPELRRPARRKGRGRKLIALGAVAALGIAAVLVGVPGMSKPLTGLFASSRTDVINFEVRRANLPVTVVERGSLESSHNEDVICEVEGQTTIITILPEGSNVTKGQLVCELDSSTLSDNLVNQRITTQGAESSYLNAKLTRQVAEIAVNEYREGIYKQEMQTALGEIALAESDLKRAEDRLEWSDKMLQKKYISTAANIADKLSLQKSRFSLEQSQTKLKVLKEYTYSKTIKELESEVKKTLSDELAKKATWELEKAKEAKLERQIKNCKLYAPNDGLVVYANDPNRFGGNNAPQVEEGATVRERQKIFSLPDITQHAGQHQGPRVDDQHDHARPARPDPRRRVRRVADDRHGRERLPHGRSDQLLQLGRQGVLDARADRQGRAGPPPRDDGGGGDPDHRAQRRPERPGPGHPRIQGQGPRHRPDPRRLRAQAR